MKVTVVCVGKLKEKYWRDAIAEYSKRLSRYMELEMIELADEKAPENMSDAQAAEVKEREGQRILQRRLPRICVWAQWNMRKACWRMRKAS